MKVKEILSQILGALPSKRDWLDPVLEAMAKDAVKPSGEKPILPPGDSVHAPTDEQIAKLPKWAQDAFKALERERFCAVRELKEWADDQTPSAVSIQEMVCTGDQRSPEFFTRYVNTSRIKIEWKGCRLEVHLTDNGPQHEDAIALKWSPLDPRTRALALVPDSFQSARLQVPENLIRR